MFIFLFCPVHAWLETDLFSPFHWVCWIQQHQNSSLLLEVNPILLHFLCFLQIVGFWSEIKISWNPMDEPQCFALYIVKLLATNANRVNMFWSKRFSRSNVLTCLTSLVCFAQPLMLVTTLTKWPGRFWVWRGGQ